MANLAPLASADSSAPRWCLERAAHPTYLVPVTDGLALGRHLLGSEYGHVSRRQAECRLIDSGLVVISHGTNPTGVKAMDADVWVWISNFLCSMAIALPSTRRS